MSMQERTGSEAGHLEGTVRGGDIVVYGLPAGHRRSLEHVPILQLERDDGQTAARRRHRPANQHRRVADWTDLGPRRSRHARYNHIKSIKFIR